jgi:hypothetical protein
MRIATGEQALITWRAKVKAIAKQDTLAEGPGVQALQASPTLPSL